MAPPPSNPSPPGSGNGSGPRLRFRRLERVPFEAEVTLRFGRTELVRAHTADLAKNGIAVRGVEARPAGTLVEFEVRYEQMAFSGLAAVAWAKGEAMGLEFRFVERAGRALIAEILERTPATPAAPVTPAAR